MLLALIGNLGLLGSLTPGSTVNSTQTATINGTSILVMSPGETRTYRVYVDDLSTGIELSGATIEATGLTFGTVTVDNSTTPKSLIVPVTGGGIHGRLYQARTTVELSDGGPLVGTLSIRVFNS